MSRFSNIEDFYEVNRHELLESDKLRPSKSTTRDVEATVNLFIGFYKKTNKEVLSTSDILKCLDMSVYNDVARTNVRTMIEFDFLREKDDDYVFTKTFKDFLNSEESLSCYILQKLYGIQNIESLTMYLNTMLCTLREGYLYDSIVMYPDSFEAFKSQLNSKEKMIEHCKKVYKIYGFKGRGRNPEDPDYTPNANYRVITELRKLNLIVNSSEMVDGFKTCKLTGNGEHLLNEINKNLSKCLNGTVNIDNLFVDERLVGFNKIYYGIPGCGKSYKVDAMLKYKDGFKEEAERNGITSKVKEDNIIRTTFYLDYSNSDFVGQIYPVVGDDGKVTYNSIPGPFTKALVRAYTHPNEMVYLVVEEINRGNAEAIFGDLFQLLDRVKETKDGKIKGESEYPISNEFIEGYLDKIIKGKIEDDGTKDRLPMLRNHNIIIPNNLTIFATMNTSDQNIFPLDTAFKRRWDLERVKVDWSKQNGKYKLPILNKCIPFTDMTWGNFASNINIKMVENCKDGIITQDKNLGPFFVDEDLLVEPKDRYNPENKQKIIQFTNNVIDYLFLDVTKFNHDVLFEKGITYSEVYDYFTESLPNATKGSEEAKRYLKIFDSNIEDDVIEKENAKPVETDPVEAGDTTDGDPQ